MTTTTGNTPTTDGAGCNCGPLEVTPLMARLGCEVHVTTAPPLVASPWTQGFVCPHGVTWWVEPTGEQRAAWVRDGVR